MSRTDSRTRLKRLTLGAAAVAVFAMGVVFVACHGANSPTEPPSAEDSASQLGSMTADAKIRTFLAASSEGVWAP